MAQIIRDGKEVRFQFSGQLTFTACETLETDVNAAVAEGPEHLIFDLAEVTFISSIFIRHCLKTFKMLGQDRFRIINATPAVMKIFTIAGLDEMVKNG